METSEVTARGTAEEPRDGELRLFLGLFSCMRGVRSAPRHAPCRGPLLAGSFNAGTLCTRAKGAWTSIAGTAILDQALGDVEWRS